MLLAGMSEPVVRRVNGGWRIIVEIVHIRAANLGGPRYDARMTDDDRRDHPNLILFCDPHHDLVDERPERYTIETLLGGRLSARRLPARRCGGSGRSPQQVSRRSSKKASNNTTLRCSALSPG